MAKTRGGRPSKGTESLEIKSGQLGPIRPCTIEIRPLTVFIGRQGTGKSLLAQVLYFFRGLPNLVEFDAAQRRPTERGATEPRLIVGRILDGLRSRHRRFANLTRPNVALAWVGDLAQASVHATPSSLGFNAQHVTRQVQPGSKLLDLVAGARQSRRRQPWTAVFIPTERLLYTLALGPTSLALVGAPLILEVFASWMEIAGRIQEEWDQGLPDTPQGKWVHRRLRDALGGQPMRRGSAWKWAFSDSSGARSIDLDMASSGQRANYPLMLVPEALFSLKAKGELAESFTLYVEEPEIHLHPTAERAIVEVLAYMVTQGFRVVITTHSLTVLYALNNLVLASEVAGEVLADEIPPEARLAPQNLIAYHLADGRPQKLTDDATGLIDERALGSVADDMANQMNRLYAARSRG